MMTDYIVDKILYESHNFLLRTRKDGKYVIFNKHTEEFHILDNEQSAIWRLVELAEEFVPVPKTTVMDWDQFGERGEENNKDDDLISEWTEQDELEWNSYNET